MAQGDMSAQWNVSEMIKVGDKIPNIISLLQTAKSSFEALEDIPEASQLSSMSDKIETMIRNLSNLKTQLMTKANDFIVAEIKNKGIYMASDHIVRNNMLKRNNSAGTTPKPTEQKDAPDTNKTTSQEGNRVNPKQAHLPNEIISDGSLPGNKKDTEADNEAIYEKIADEVYIGDWGNGEEREKRLADAGYDWRAVQAIVNFKYYGIQPPDIEQEVNPQEPNQVTINDSLDNDETANDESTPASMARKAAEPTEESNEVKTAGATDVEWRSIYNNKDARFGLHPELSKPRN